MSQGNIKDATEKAYYLLKSDGEGDFVSILHLSVEEFKMMWNAFLEAEISINDKYSAPPVLYNIPFPTKEAAEEFERRIYHGETEMDGCNAIMCGVKDENRETLKHYSLEYYFASAGHTSLDAVKETIKDLGYEYILEEKYNKDTNDLINTLVQKYEQYLKTAPKDFLNPFAEGEEWVADPRKNQEELKNIASDHFRSVDTVYKIGKEIRQATYDGKIPDIGNKGLVGDNGNSALLDLYECVGHIKKVEKELGVEFYHEPFTKMVDAYMEYRKTAEKGYFDPHDGDRFCIDFEPADKFVRQILNDTVTDFLKEQLPQHDPSKWSSKRRYDLCAVVMEINNMEKANLITTSMTKDDFVKIKNTVIDIIEKHNLLVFDDEPSRHSGFSTPVDDLIHQIYMQVRNGEKVGEEEEDEEWEI